MAILIIDRVWVQHSSLEEGGEKVFGATDFTLKSAQIVDFESTVDRGSAVNFGADSGL